MPGCTGKLVTFVLPEVPLLFVMPEKLKVKSSAVLGPPPATTFSSVMVGTVTTR